MTMAGLELTIIFLINKIMHSSSISWTRIGIEMKDPRRSMLDGTNLIEWKRTHFEI